MESSSSHNRGRNGPSQGPRGSKSTDFNRKTQRIISRISLLTSRSFMVMGVIDHGLSVKHWGVLVLSSFFCSCTYSVRIESDRENDKCPWQRLKATVAKTGHVGFFFVLCVFKKKYQLKIIPIQVLSVLSMSEVTTINLLLLITFTSDGDNFHIVDTGALIKGNVLGVAGAWCGYWSFRTNDQYQHQLPPRYQ